MTSKPRTTSHLIGLAECADAIEHRGTHLFSPVVDGIQCEIAIQYRDDNSIKSRRTIFWNGCERISRAAADTILQSE